MMHTFQLHFCLAFFHVVVFAAPKDNKNVVCGAGDTFLEHGEDCTKYYVCSNGTPLEMSCPAGSSGFHSCGTRTYWDQTNSVCSTSNAHCKYPCDDVPGTRGYCYVRDLYDQCVTKYYYTCYDGVYDKIEECWFYGEIYSEERQQCIEIPPCEGPFC